jgi:hypothetical protein
VQLYTLSKTSLAKAPSSVTELYIPLWVADGTLTTATATSSGTTFLLDGGSAGAKTSAASLHTLNANWSPSQKFALEVSIANNTGGNTTNAALWDITSNTIVSGTQASVTATTVTVVRSGQFTLLPGHVYGVTIWCNAGTAQISDASLVVFGS